MVFCAAPPSSSNCNNNYSNTHVSSAQYVDAMQSFDVACDRLHMIPFCVFVIASHQIRLYTLTPEVSWTHFFRSAHQKFLKLSFIPILQCSPRSLERHFVVLFLHAWFHLLSYTDDVDLHDYVTRPSRQNPNRRDRRKWHRHYRDSKWDSDWQILGCQWPSRCSPKHARGVSTREAHGR